MFVWQRRTEQRKAKQSKAIAEQLHAKHSKAQQSNAKHSKAKQSSAMQRTAEQCQAKPSNTMQSAAKIGRPIFFHAKSSPPSSSRRWSTVFLIICCYSQGIAKRSKDREADNFPPKVFTTRLASFLSLSSHTGEACHQTLTKYSIDHLQETRAWPHHFKHILAFGNFSLYTGFLYKKQQIIF